MPARDVEAAENCHWQEKHDDILRDVDAGIREPDSLLVEALSAGDTLVPEEFDRVAQEDAAEERPKAMQYNGAHYDKGSLAEATDWEHAKILC